MSDVIIVGAGLFGSIAAALSRAEGHNVTVIDSGEKWAASPASGCVLAPSWLSSLDKNELETSFAVLRQLYTVHEVEFLINNLKKFRAWRVQTSQVLVKPDIVERVARIKSGVVELASGQKLAGNVLVAAGLGCTELIEGLPPLRGLWGASLSVKTQLDHPRIHVYAPYRQAVAFNMTPKLVWMGDGTALIKNTWEKEQTQRVAETISRAKKYFKLPEQQVKVFAGARPYMADYKAGFFEKVLPRVWVSTGGAKNGTALAALNAHRFVKGLK